MLFTYLIINPLILQILAINLIYNETFTNIQENEITHFLPKGFMLGEHKIIYVTLTQLDKEDFTTLQVCTSNITSACMKDEISIQFKHSIQYIRIMLNVVNNIMEQEYSAITYTSQEYFLRVKSSLQPHDFQIKVEEVEDTVCYQPCQYDSDCNSGNCLCRSGYFGIDCSIRTVNIADAEILDENDIYYLDLIEQPQQDYIKKLNKEFEIQQFCSANHPNLIDADFIESSAQLTITKEVQQQCKSNYEQQILTYKVHNQPLIIIKLVLPKSDATSWESQQDPQVLGIILGCLGSLLLFMILCCMDVCKKAQRKYRLARNRRELQQKLDVCMPEFLYSIIQMKFPGLKEDNECLICLTIFKLEDKVRLTYCTHLFHKDCVEEWIIKNKENATCPICREHFTEQINNNALKLNIYFDETYRDMLAHASNPSEVFQLKKISHRLLGNNVHLTPPKSNIEPIESQTRLTIENS